MHFRFNAGLPLSAGRSASVTVGSTANVTITNSISAFSGFQSTTNFTLTALVPGNASGTLTDNVSIAAANNTDPNSSNNSLTSSPASISAPDIVVTFLSQPNGSLGGSRTMQLQVKNQGTAAATNTVLTVTASAGCTISTMTQGIVSGAVFSAPVIAGNKLTATVTFSSIIVGGTANFNVTELISPGLLRQMARTETNAVSQATGFGFEQRQRPTRLRRQPSSVALFPADLVVAQNQFRAGTSIVAGSNTVRSYDLSVGNAGPSNQTNVVQSPFSYGRRLRLYGLHPEECAQPASQTSSRRRSTRPLEWSRSPTRHSQCQVRSRRWRLRRSCCFSETVPANATPGTVADILAHCIFTTRRIDRCAAGRSDPGK